MTLGYNIATMTRPEHNSTEVVADSTHAALLGLAVPMLETILDQTGWRVISTQTGKRGTPSGVADLVVQLGSERAQTAAVVEVRTSPRRADAEALVQRTRQAAEGSAMPTLVLFAPRISHPLAGYLRELGIGYFDLSGACRLSAPGLFIERLRSEEPPLSPAEHPGVRKFTAGPATGITARSVLGVRPVMRHRVLRAMLSYPKRKWHQTELAEETHTNVSSHVHRVVSFLEREHYADHEGRGPHKVIFLTRPGDLLNDWAVHWRDTWNMVWRSAGRYLSLAANADVTRQAAEDAARDLSGTVGFTLASGAEYYGSFLRDDVVCAYYRGNASRLAQECGFEEVDRGANVILLPARDDGIFYLPEQTRQRLETRQSAAAGPVCAVQLYLDMRVAGGRYAEQAEVLRQREIGY